MGGQINDFNITNAKRMQIGSVSRAPTIIFQTFMVEMLGALNQMVPRKWAMMTYIWLTSLPTSQKQCQPLNAFILSVYVNIGTH